MNKYSTIIPQALTAAFIYCLSLPTACLSAVDCRPLGQAPVAAPVAFDITGNTASIQAGQYAATLKSENGKSAFIITPAVIVRSTGADLLIDVSSTRCTIAVVSGTALLKNRLDKHVLELKAGTVYAADTTPFQFGPVQQPSLVKTGQWLPLFTTTKCRSALSVILQPANETSNALAARIVSPPTVLSYEFGTDVSRYLKLSDLMREHYPPAGFVSTPQAWVAEQIPTPGQ